MAVVLGIGFISPSVDPSSQRQISRIEIAIAQKLDVKGVM